MFGIADDIVIAGFDDMGRDHDATLDKVLRICRYTSLKLNKGKCLFRCTKILFFIEVRLQEVPDDAALCPKTFSSTSLSSIAWWYRNIVGEALGILHGLEKSCHHCFAKEVYTVTDHKPSKVMVNIDVATLSQWLQCIMLHIHQYSMCIQYKPGPDLYIVDWLSFHSHTENWDQEIVGMGIRIETISTAGNIVGQLSCHKHTENWVQEIVGMGINICTISTAVSSCQQKMSELLWVKMQNCRCYRHTS